MAQALRRMDSRRPMTHELFMQVLQRARIDVIAVRLVGRDEGNLLAELDLMTPAGRERVDCRPSDGIVLALAHAGARADPRRRATARGGGRRRPCGGRPATTGPALRRVGHGTAPGPNRHRSTA